MNNNKIFGIGWARTGTTTLAKCFEILGFAHQSQELNLAHDIAKGDLSRIMALAKEKDTFEDWPWIILYRELDQAFPGSRFVLTRRDPARWLRSYQNMLSRQGKASEELNQIRRIFYGLPFPDVTETQLVERYERHNQEVLAWFQDRPEALLVVDWEKGHDWSELCRFLSRDIPPEPFPHANRGEYAPSR